MNTHDDEMEPREGALALLASEPELEAAFFEALDGGPESEALQAWLAAHPEAAAELDELRAVQGALRGDREARSPGPHFFEALHADIMAELDSGDAPGVVELQGGEVAPMAPAAEGQSWFAWLRALLIDRPSVSYGFGMALALLGIVLWALAGAGDVRPGSSEVAVGADAGTDLPAAVAKLPAAEREELRAMAAQIDIDVLDEDDDEDDGVEWSGLVGEEYSTAELDEFEDELRRAL